MESEGADLHGHRERRMVIAHRGASGHAPENTLAAFALAAEMGASAVELDVHLSRDRQIVVIHDSRVERTTSGRGAVRNLILARLRRLDAGSWFNRSHPGQSRPEFVGQRVPTLQEAIDLAKRTKIGLYIETKDPELYPEDFEAKIVTLLRRNNFGKRAVLLSFSADSIKKVKGADSSIQTAFLVSRSKKGAVSAAAAAGADELAIHHTLLTPGMLLEARAAGMRISTWTVNNVPAIRRMAAMGADRIITNYPDRALRILVE
jgi:glycerophosphoryl diester phosphodiesterase